MEKLIDYYNENYTKKKEGIILLPKLEYPKNKMDMYRAFDFIATMADFTHDDGLYHFMNNVILPYPSSNINEIDLYFNNEYRCDIFGVRRNAYFINTDKDNYYTILDAIKKGKTIYRNFDTPLVNWSINKEEKIINFKNYIMFTETGSELLES